MEATLARSKASTRNLRAQLQAMQDERDAANKVRLLQHCIAWHNKGKSPHLSSLVRAKRVYTLKWMTFPVNCIDGSSLKKSSSESIDDNARDRYQDRR